MSQAVIVSSVRTAVGKAPRGTLRETRPDDMAAVAIRGALARVPGLQAEDVVLGCATPEAEQGLNIARQAAFLAAIPFTAGAMTINRYCASGLSAIALGHPLGCTGAKLTAQLLHEMARRQLRYGMVTMCVGGGMGASGIFERM